MCQRQAAFGYHLHQVSQAQLEAKIPAHAQDDDLAVKVATLEQLLDAHQLAHAHPSGSSADIIAGQILPFAPEPDAGRTSSPLGRLTHRQTIGECPLFAHSRRPWAVLATCHLKPTLPLARGSEVKLEFRRKKSSRRR
jgi:hypothetical protein